MPQPIQNPTVGQQLQKAFNLVGRVRPVLDEVLIPVVQVADLAQGAQLPVTRTVSWQFRQIAVAAEYMVATMVVPGNILTAIDTIYVRASGNTFLGISHGNNYATPASAVNKYYMDQRVYSEGEIPASAMFRATQAAAPGALQNTRVWLAADVMTRVDTPGLVVGTGKPGETAYLELYILTVNLQVDMTVQGREYQAV